MIESQQIAQLHLNEGKSLRQICREMEIPEGRHSALATMLRQAGYEVRRGKLGPKVGDKITVTCPSCQQSRVIVSRTAQHYERLCRKCGTSKSHKDNPRIGRAENHYNWKGGLNLNRQGYILEYVKKSNPFFSMAANTHRAGGYILQHRLVMARHLGRLLSPNEVVHHKNGNKQDNSIANLQLANRQMHGLAYWQAYRDGYTQAMKDCGKKYGMVRHGRA